MDFYINPIVFNVQIQYNSLPNDEIDIGTKKKNLLYRNDQQ